MNKLLPVTVTLALALATAFGATVAPRPLSASPLVSGVDRSGFDESARPQDDFNQYVNGGWIARTEIPPDKSRWGSFLILRQESDRHQREIIEELAGREDLKPGSEAKKIGDLYASLMDEKRIHALGVAPVRFHLEIIDAIASQADLVRAFAKLRRAGATSPIAQFINVDSGNSTQYAVYLSQSGLGLPNRNYYLKEGEKFDEIRSRYPGHIATLFELAGFDGGAERAEAIYALEMKIAEAQWPPEESRDATKTNNRYEVAHLTEVSTQIDWSAFLDAAGMGSQRDLFVRQPSYMEKLGGLIAEVPLEDWKNYLRFHVLDAAAPWLSEDFVTANFEFFGKLIDGQEELEPRWQRAVRTVNRAMGEAVGKMYVERYFPPEAKGRMDELVENVLRAFEVSIENLDWMSEETKAKAQEKREKFTSKIGYPEKWKDYSALEIRRDDAVGNLARARAWDYDRRLARLGGPVDRSEWFMSPQTVNAYHNPRMNEIVFPAAILQPPFFNLEADDAVNYGAIGAVIGHEIGHAFDDQGRKTDGDGNLNDWWTDADAEAFTAKAEALVEQYNAFEVLPDLFVNGELTLGENIGDLTGVYIGYLAYKMSLDGREAPVIDGLTGDQRFFIGYAQIWRAKGRDEYLRRLVLTNPHSPSMFRANGPLRNFAPFYEAFDVEEGDSMYLPPDERVQIW
ncbi:MAG: peptidase M13 [Candidatus Latescibacterota bacterium]|nr:MAG: peptidase M13 [Candidatus Latescibacterota bacterium]